MLFNLFLWERRKREIFATVQFSKFEYSLKTKLNPNFTTSFTKGYKMANFENL